MDNSTKTAIIDHFNTFTNKDETETFQNTEKTTKYIATPSTEAFNKFSYLLNDKQKEESIGIWKFKKVAGKDAYVRDTNQSPDWRFWSQKNVIPAKGLKKRVLLLGESVARGYFYDPHYTPSMVLEKAINSVGGDCDVEIVDLARTSMGLVDLAKLTSSCVALEPEAMVIFAGNNWLTTLRGKIDTESILNNKEITDNNNFYALKEVLEKRFEEEVKNFVDYLSDLSKKHNFPILFVIPEFNLLDWESSKAERITPLLPEKMTSQWRELVELGERAIAENDVDEAKKLATAIIQLDKSHPLGYELMAKCKLKENLLDEARELLEIAKDTAYYCRAVGQPRIYSIIYKTLINETRRNNIRVVDLKEIFKTHLNGGLPGRRIFLDYCHLTVEGIQVAMAHTAKAIISLFENKEVLVEQLLEASKTLVPNSDVEACAHLCASIHNAHWGQPYEIIEYHCNKAVEASPNLSIKFITHYTSLINRRLSSVLCKSYEQLLNSQVISQYEGGTGFLHGRGKKLLDIDLTTAMTRALSKIKIDISDKIENLRIKEHTISNKKINLLESFYSTFSYDNFLAKQAPFYQSREVDSKFVFISDESTPVNLNLTYRTPRSISSNDDIFIQINGVEVASVKTNEKWVRSSIQVDRKYVKKGLNELKVLWSTNLSSGLTRKNNFTVDSLLDSIYPVWGEIHSFTLNTL